MGKKALKKKVMQGLDIFLLLNWHIYAHFLKNLPAVKYPCFCLSALFQSAGQEGGSNIFFSALLTFDLKVLEIFQNFWIFSGNTDFA